MQLQVSIIDLDPHLLASLSSQFFEIWRDCLAIGSDIIDLPNALHLKRDGINKGGFLIFSYIPLVYL